MGVLTAILLCGCLGIAAAAYFVVQGFERGGHSYSAEFRERIDALAAAVPERSFARETAEWSGDLTSLLTSRMELTEDEELELAEKVHAEITAAYPVEKTPETIAAIQESLSTQVPESLLPPGKRFRVTVIDDGEAAPLTGGAGRIYLTTAQLAPWRPWPRFEPAIAFLLAHEMGHVCRHHSRQGYERLLSHQDRERGWLGKLGGDALQEKSDAWIRKRGELLHLAYDERQDREADLFAVALCEAAGYDVEAALDLVRRLLLETESKLQEDAEDGVFDADFDPERFSDEGRRLCRRLNRLRSELDGTIEDPEYGLFELDESGKSAVRFEPSSTGDAPSPVVLVHGMESGPKGLFPFMRLARGTLKGRTVLGFRYPNDDSLVRTARFLKREIARTLPPDAVPDFIVHSAGGLVTRFYHEVLDGPVGNVVFFGTPHRGSDLARLRAALELFQVLKGIRLDLSDTFRQAIADGDGQIAHDLLPDSLFLSRLERRRGEAENYHIFAGRALSERRAESLESSFAGSVRLARLSLLPLKATDAGRKAIARLERFRIPEEILAGDLAVSLSSARLPGVRNVEEVPLDHVRMFEDDDLRRRALSIVGDR